MRFSAALILMLATLLIMGCTSSGGGSDATHSDTPIAELLGLESDPTPSEDQFIEEEWERQELIAICMQEQGFDYIPIDPSDAVAFTLSDGLEWGSEEWTAKYGFGVSTLAFPQETVGPGLVGYTSAPVGMDEFVDPNLEIVEAMGEKERIAYYDALHGEGFAIEAVDGGSMEPEGCDGEAYRQSGRAEKEAFRRAFADELNEMYERMEADPLVVRHQREVTRCVAGEGYAFASMEDVYREFDEQLLAVYEETTVGEELTEQEAASMGQDEIEEKFGREPTLSDRGKDLLAEIQQSERALAEAVRTCGGGPDVMEDLFQELVVDYKKQFLEDHSEELAEFRSE